MTREFSANHPLLYILAGLAILVVSLQSVIFLVRALRRAKELGYSKQQLNKLMTAAALFTIAPAVAIGIGIITLSPSLGIPLPWLRLSVVGAIVYELSAAETAASAVGATLGNSINLTAQQFSAIAWTMTVGIITGLVLIPIFNKKTQNSLSSIENKDKVWGEHLVNAIFFGLIATFVGVGLHGVTLDAEGRVTALVLLVSAVVMAILGLLKKKFGWKWLNDYALPICMILAMASAIPLSAVVK